MCVHMCVLSCGSDTTEIFIITTQLDVVFPWFFIQTYQLELTGFNQNQLKPVINWEFLLCQLGPVEIMQLEKPVNWEFLWKQLTPVYHKK